MAEPFDSFGYARRKVERAKKHITDFYLLEKAFIKRKPYTVSFKHDPNVGGHVFRVGLTESIPADLPLIVGDAVHNLRAALDYCWMGAFRALPKQRQKAARNPKLTLPIGSTRQDLVSATEKTLVAETFPQIVGVLADGIKAYKGGNDALFAVNGLDNRDKHNLLILTAGVTDIYNIRVTDGRGLTINTEHLRVQANQPVNVHTILTKGKLKLEYDTEPTVRVIFDKVDRVGSQPVLPALVQFVEATSQAVESFAEAFASKPA